MIDVLISEKIERLVDTLICAGCDIQAVGSGYCLNEPDDELMLSVVNSILAAFGPRDHLVADIHACLRRKGRVVEV
ncbi:hypothetical protein CFBP6625_26285 (plasmid) [Agrobacterium tumefaciens]|nr:hypothetical protein CFBP6625_26285 [Agrobacterium tumefaciens]